MLQTVRFLVFNLRGFDFLGGSVAFHDPMSFCLKKMQHVGRSASSELEENKSTRQNLYNLLRWGSLIQLTTAWLERLETKQQTVWKPVFSRTNIKIPGL